MWKPFLFVVACLSGVASTWSQTEPVLYRLHPVAEGFSIVLPDVDREGQSEVAFKKEPDFQDRKIFRSAIPLGPGRDAFIGFAWDRSQKTLYVDLNRNLDLTDDTAGVFANVLTDAELQLFEQIPISIHRDDISIPYVISLSAFAVPGYSSVNITVISGWKGTVDLAGKSWELGICDDLDGTIEQGDVFILSSIPGDGSGNIPSWRHQIEVPKELFTDGHTYRLGFSFEAAPATTAARPETDLVAKVEEIAPPLADLRIEGLFISQLDLQGERAVLLRSPGQMARVPAGMYGPVHLAIDSGPKIRFSTSLSTLHVLEETGAILKAGGPLRSKVETHRQGPKIEMSYSLVGIGGEAYERSVPGLAPTVTVAKAGKLLRTGKFEYG